jgi:PAS domain S-box-containing protein
MTSIKPNYTELSIVSPSTEQIQILHVEDQRDFADLTTSILEDVDARFSIETAANPSEGLAQLDEDIDCIVSDYEMPGMNGLEFLEAVRENYPQLPFILFTGKGSEEIASEAISAGVTDYLQKETGTDQFTILANRVVNAVEQYRTRTELERRNKQLETVMANAPLIVFALDTDGEFLLSQGRGLARLGLARGELVGDSVFDVYADYDNILSDVTRALDGDTVMAEREIGNGVFKTTYQPVFDEEETVDFVIGVAMDITEQVERERELDAERQRFQKLFTNLSQPAADLVYEADVPVVRQVNQAFEDTFGYEADEIVGTSLDEYIVPAGRQTEATEINNRVQTTEELTSEEVRRRTADGERDFRLENAVYDDGSKAFAIYTDITERKQRERELETLRKAIDNAHVPITLADPSGANNPIVYVNNRFEEVTGYTEAEALGENCRFLQGEETDSEPVAKLRDAIDAEETVTVELRNYRKDGTMFWNRVSVRPIYCDGELVRYFGSQEDITERKEFQKRLQRQNDRLGKFAQVVSHDLQNPLQVAHGNVALAKERCNCEELETAAEALTRSQTLVDDLLTVAREGVRVGETEPIDLQDTIQRCWENVATAEATLTIRTDERIEADQSRFRQLMENLLSNAVEHCGRTVHVRIGSLVEETGVYIADDGPGIPPGKRKAVFESGYSTAEDGTGFGLAIVREIVRGHDWEIKVTESDADGTRFEITDIEFSTA